MSHTRARGSRLTAAATVMAVTAALVTAQVATPAPAAATEASEQPEPQPLFQGWTTSDTEPSAPVDDPLFDLQWHLRRINAPAAWELTRGSSEVTVAVIDTGVDPNHQDLDGAFWRDPSDGSVGRDLVNRTQSPYSSASQDWHGTAVASIAAARADDAYGIAGVAPEASVMVMKIYASESETTPPVLEGGYEPAVEAIGRAVDLGADVLLLTWGGTDPSPQLQAAISNAEVPVVVAAGNDDVDLSSADADVRRYPAMYRLPNLVTVTASDLDDRPWTAGEAGANVGVQHVDIAAPGELVIGVHADAGHRYHEGTSFAAPQVAGALALARTLVPRAGASELVGELSRTARPAPAFEGLVTSDGILDIEAFLAAVQRPVCGEEFPRAPFLDVATGSTHQPAVDCITAYGLASGVTVDRFAPEAGVTRGQMATFVARTLDRAGAIDLEDWEQRWHDETASDTGSDDADGSVGGDDAPEAPFDDVAGTTHEAAIALVASLGIADGYPDGTFRPRAQVTRGQMASFLSRTVEGLTDDIELSQRRWFDDVAGTTHEDAIVTVRELGITLGTVEPRIYAPLTTLSRGQMASLLARTLDALAREGVMVSRPES